MKGKENMDNNKITVKDLKTILENYDDGDIINLASTDEARLYINDDIVLEIM